MELKKYFATLEGEKLGKELVGKINDYNTNIRRTGMIHLWRRLYDAYYKGVYHKGSVLDIGEKREFAAVYINDVRNFVQHLLSITTSTPPEPEPQAINTDYKSQSQVILCKQFLDYANKTKFVPRYLKRATEAAIAISECFTEVEWDANIGDEFMPEEEQGREEKVRYTGDIRLNNYISIDAIRDVGSKDGDEFDWIILRRYENKHVLAAIYTENEEKILNYKADEKDIWLNTWNAERYSETDVIPVYRFYHKKDAAVRNGKLTLFLGDGTILYDNKSGLPYKRIPVSRIAPANIIGTMFGYSVSFDLMPLQKVQNSLYSTIYTNQKTFGTQNIAVEKGSSINSSSIPGALNLIEVPKGAQYPKGLNLTATAPEIFNFLPIIDRKGEQMSGVNAVVRGNPDTGLNAGVSLALLNSNSIQFNQPLNQSYQEYCENVYTDIIDIYKSFCTLPREIMIVGKNNKSLLKEFTGDMISEISRVTVNMGNPLNRTTAGRYSMAQEWMKNGLIKNTDQFLQVVATGNAEPTYKSEQTSVMLIQSENEMIQSGIAPQGMKTDDHWAHILEHSVVLASPEVREDPNSPIIVAATEHIQWHIDISNQMRMLEPDLLMIVSPRMFNVPPEEAQPPAPQGVNDKSAKPKKEGGVSGETQQVKDPVTGEVLQERKPI